MTSFELNSRQPYFFSKQMSVQNPQKYFFNIKDALQTTFSHPGVLIDDLAFIEPFNYFKTNSWLSYLFARYVLKEESREIRVLSISPMRSKKRPKWFSENMDLNFEYLEVQVAN